MPELARAVAYIVAGASYHAEKIISGIKGTSPRIDKAIDSAISKIYLTPAVEMEDKAPLWHRDGLLFQAISWIAANLEKPSNALIAAPHVIKAHKGLDGLLVNIDNNDICLTIFEDKAGNPEGLITKIMTEFREMEFDDSYKAEEILQETATLLRMHRPEGWEDLINDAFWLKNRKYRASLASLDSHCTETGAQHLFRNFGKAVLGPVDRRIGHLMASDDVRKFFRNFAKNVIDELNAIKTPVVAA
ncbi:hypothetical protein [Methylobacterium currus]|uniref:hypothetical protein n=1 Tax=Methylobacterium currus TaxID=2051553 RepID=UPI000F4E395F|nr:hypothetical protein [Methylobacterium currus]